VAPSLFMIEVRKAAGDTLEYHKVHTDASLFMKWIFVIANLGVNELITVRVDNNISYWYFCSSIKAFAHN